MWFLLAVLAAATQVARNLFMKRIGHALDETINVWGRFTFILPFALAIMLIRGIPTVQPGFWPVALAFTGVQLAATLSLSKALKVAEISLVTALWKLSIVLLVFWGFVTLGEKPPALGLVGVCLSVAGVYLVNVRRARKNPWAPLLALVQEPGQRWTLVACMFYAPTVALSKQMAMLSDVPFSIVAGYLLCSVALTPYTIYRSGRNFRRIGAHWKDFVSMGAVSALSAWFSIEAYVLTMSSYVEAVKQVEVLMAMAVGVVMFKERDTVRNIWPGVLVMAAGLVLLKLSD